MIDEVKLKALIMDAVREVLKEHPRAGSDDYLSIADAASVAAVTPKTVRAWISEGRLRRYHAGRELRVKRSDLDAALASADCPDPHEEALRLVRSL